MQQRLIPGFSATKSPVPPDSPVMTTVWIRPGETVTVQNLEIACGGFYLGNTLKTQWRAIESAQIDPTLEINFLTADGLYFDEYTPWPGYDRFTPEHRGAFLLWLADGHPVEEAHRAFIELLLAGIERRLAIDLIANPSQHDELPVLRLLVDELGAFYELEPDEEDDDYDDDEFYLDESTQQHGRYMVAQLRDLINALLYQSTGALPDRFVLGSPEEVPVCIPIALADRAIKRTTVSAGLALAWVWYHPRYSIRKAAGQYTAVFARLFEIRFAEAYPEGMTVRVGKRVMKPRYSRFAPGWSGFQIELPEIPNVYGNTGALAKVATIFYQVEHEMGQFLRALATRLSPKQMLLAVGSLPREVIGMFPDQIEPVGAAAARWLGNKEVAVVEGKQLIALWPVSTPGKITEYQAKSLFKVLDTLGYGIEPDPRFHGPVPTADSKHFVFRQDLRAPESADVRYHAARILGLLAVLVAQAGGQVSDSMLELVSRHVAGICQLDPYLGQRLMLSLTLLAETPVKTTGLAKQAESLGIAGRDQLGRLLCALGVAEGDATPARMKALGKAYGVLGLDPALVTSHVHLALTREQASVHKPIDLRGPLEPVAATLSIALDPHTISRKVAQSNEISAILSDIFTEDEPEIAAAAPVATSAWTPTGTLDAAHAELLRAVVARDSWPRAEFDVLAAQFRLLPEGAIDTLNEAAFEAVGEPLLDGDDVLAVNSEAAEELCT